MNDTLNHKAIQLTAEGLEELQKELKELVEVKLPEAVARVAKAREYGDLSENAEYHSAREDQQLLEARISEIEDVLSRAQVVKQTKSHTAVGMGSQVTVCMSGKKAKQMVITIVGEFEADPTAGKISSVSPLGKALMSKKKGDKVKVKAPAGEVEYEILEIK
ncbi:MAG TPA: transcription elongation factor GreA [Vitreimonas sp.]|nr:transcription elongation factor GreA [Vitreimonas sp.]